MRLFGRRQRVHRDDGRRSAMGSARPEGRSGGPENDLPDWRSYDLVGEAYGRVAEQVTAPPALDLVKLLEVTPGARTLDVGTGTGVAARAVGDAAGSQGVIVGVDPSLPMLELAARRGGEPRFAAATSIDLPFRDESFSRVILNFVIAHFTRYDTALFEVMRVLNRGGRLGVTTWAPGENDDDFSRAWENVAEEFAEHEILQDARDRAVPWEERFSDPVRLKDALHEAGLRDIWVERRDYRVEMTAEEYVDRREVSSVGRFLHEMLGPELWDTFHRRALTVFSERFPERFHDFHQVILAVGHKP